MRARQILISNRERILADHKQWLIWEARRLGSPLINYLERFYGTKYKLGKLSLGEIATKVNEISSLPREVRKHIIEHIALIRRIIHVPRPRSKQQAIRILKAHPEIRQLRYSKFRRAERDIANRIHVRDLKTGKFLKLTSRRTPKGKMKGR